MKEAFKKGIFLRLVWMLPAVVTLAGCATQIPLNVQRMPAMDTSGFRRISIMPFEPSGGSYANAARYATTVATGRIQATNHFTLVNYATVNDARRRGENIENYVDALFTGQIIRIEENMKTQQGQRRDKEGETVTYTYYVREVEVEFSYSLTRARDGIIIGTVVKRGQTSRQDEQMGNLPSSDALVNGIIESQLRYIDRDVAPYTVRISRSLEKEPNKELKPEMDLALSHVKGGNYIAARQIYISVWQSYRSIAAAINASILYEATGETQTAANFMEDVLAASGSPKARDALARLRNELAEQARVRQYAAAQSPVERVSGHATGEVQRILSAEAKVWVYNNAANNQNLANDVIDNMISIFLRNGIPVVERQMIDLILQEQDFQLSGSVSDADIVRIGNLAGANTIVIIGITGSGATRRLQVRVLDVGEGIVIMQSGIGGEWNL